MYYGLAVSSKKVRKGFIFSIKGHNKNGEKFIKEAIKKGASVIVCSKSCKYFNKSIVTIKTSNVRYLLSEISSKFFNLKPKNIIAVTGTNGKTSVADLFYQILLINKVPVASNGTLGIKFKKKIIKYNLTSPDTILLHQTLEKIKKGIDNVIIETSSHGLIQHRVDHLNFNAGIFTNLSQDHLDYHKSMRSYLNAKMLLFNKLMSKRKIIISDKSLKQFALLKKISKKRELKLVDISLIVKKLNKNKNIKFKNFQIKNLSMAIAAAKLCDLKEKKIFLSLNKIKDVDGRLELVKIFSNNIRVYVDFAHTPDAFLNLLQLLKTQIIKMYQLFLVVVVIVTLQKDL